MVDQHTPVELPRGYGSAADHASASGSASLHASLEMRGPATSAPGPRAANGRRGRAAVAGMACMALAASAIGTRRFQSAPASVQPAALDSMAAAAVFDAGGRGRFALTVGNAYGSSTVEPLGVANYEQELAEGGTVSSYAFVEPHCVTTLSLAHLVAEAEAEADDRSTTSATSLAFEAFTANGAELTKVGLAENSVGVVFAQLGEDVVTVRVTSADGSTSVLRQRVVCQYVRRELRRLSDSDRSAFLDAMQVVYTESAEVGKAKYGASFTGIAHFVAEHLKGAATRDCDHWHDGSSILMVHTAFSLEFERALQVVDPRVSLAFWDYTVDDATYGANWTESPIFDDDWFGAVPATDGGEGASIPRGRWANLKLPRISDVAADERASVQASFTNSFGLMRAPWNASPSPFVLRSRLVVGSKPFTALPSCDTFKAAWQSDSLAEFNEAMNGVAHGQVHVATGGHWGVDTTKLDVAGWSEHREQLLLVAKNLWRQGYIRCDEGSACACPAQLTTGAGKGGYEVLLEAGQLNWLSKYATALGVPDGSGSEEDLAMATAWDGVLSALCSVGQVGDMYTSASPVDPLFWIIHPNLDRLLMLRRTSSRSFDESWGYAHNELTASDTAVVCDWSGVSAGTDVSSMPNCTRSASCSGHAKDDALPVQLEEDFTLGTFAEYVHPDNLRRSYRYENYEWGSCGTALVE